MHRYREDWTGEDDEDADDEEDEVEEAEEARAHALARSVPGLLRPASATAPPTATSST